MKLSASYISYVLPIVTIFNLDVAKLFYPYVFLCSIIGILITIVTILHRSSNEFIKVIFPDLIPYIFEIGSFMHNFLNVVFIFYKICLIKYYPYNFSIRSIIASSLLFLIYFIYLKCIVIN